MASIFVFYFYFATITAQECYELYWTNPGRSTFYKNSNSHPNKTNKTCETPLEKQRRTYKWTFSHRRTSVGRPTRTYVQQLCTDTGCSLEDLPEAMDDRDGWWESQGNSVWHDNDIYLYIHIWPRDLEKCADRKDWLSHRLFKLLSRIIHELFIQIKSFVHSFTHILYSLKDHNSLYGLPSRRRSSRIENGGVVANVLDYNSVVRGFEFQSRYYVPFWPYTLEKKHETHYPDSYGLNRTTTVFFSTRMAITLNNPRGVDMSLNKGTKPNFIAMWEPSLYFCSTSLEIV